jgi:hypothetical protein
VIRNVVRVMAVTGLVGSFLMNLATFAHYNPLSNRDSVSILFGGLFVVWIGTIPVWQRLGFGPRQWESAPDEVKDTALLLLGYLCFAVVTIIPTLVQQGSKPENVGARIPVPVDYSARVVTAVLMFFYGFVVASQNADKS